MKDSVFYFFDIIKRTNYKKDIASSCTRLERYTKCVQPITNLVRGKVMFSVILFSGWGSAEWS